MDENNNVVVRVPEQQIIRGEDGYSPVVTIEEIEHGHSVTITDKEHPEGQSFDVLDGASAYEQAVAGGYTKSEAQFNAELGSFGELSEQAASSAAAAAQSESDASESASIAEAAKDDALTAQGKAEDAQAGAERAQAAAEEVVIISDTEPTSEANKIWINSLADNVQVPTAEELYAVFTTDTAQSEGDILLEDGAYGIPVKSLTVNIEPVQAAGTPTPETPLPISGWSGCYVTRAGGKNLFPLPKATQTVTVKGVDYTPNPDTTITVDGTASGGNSNYYLAGDEATFVDLDLMPGTYTLSGGTSIAYIYVIAQGKQTLVDTGNGITLTVAEGDLFRIFIRVGNGKTATNHIVRPMIRRASDTDPTFEPYRGHDTYHVTFPSPDPGTVYSGTLDVVSGVLTVYWAMVDMGTMTWVQHPTNLTVPLY